MHRLVTHRFERRGRVEVNRVFGRRLETMPLISDHVQQHRAVDFSHHLQVLFKHTDIVAVNRTKVLKPKVLKHHAAVQASFDAFFNLMQQTLRRITQNRYLAQHLYDFVFDAFVNPATSQTIQVPRHPAHRRANRHLVVVQNHQHFRFQKRGIVDRFHHHARRKRTITNHRDTVIVAAHNLITATKPDCRRHTRSRMTGHE